MEEMGAITKVEGPSEWCAGKVVVAKKSLNAARISSHYHSPLPSLLCSCRWSGMARYLCARI